MTFTTKDNEQSCGNSESSIMTRCEKSIATSRGKSIKRSPSSQRWKTSLSILLLGSSSCSVQAWMAPSSFSSSRRIESSRDVEDSVNRKFGLRSTVERRRRGILKDSGSSTVGYVPDGLTADEYMKIKRRDAAKIQGNDDVDSISTGGSNNDFFQILTDARESYEMMAMTTATGIILSAILVYILGSNNGDILYSEPETVVGNIMEATVPGALDDAAAIAISESIGGVLASFGTNFVSMLLQYRIMPKMMGQSSSSSNSDDTTKQQILMDEKMGSENYVNKAIAESDFFIVRSASLPLLQEVFGIPRGLATVGSVLVATVPYEILKFGAISKKQRQDEEELLNQMLEEELARKRRNKLSQISLPGFLSTNESSQRNQQRQQQQDIDDLLPVAPIQRIDLVSAFGDTVKWLQYDVLKAELIGVSSIYFGREIPLAVESSIFGAMAALSAGIWADLCYAISERDNILAAGGDDERLEISNRFRRYGIEAIRGAALFGIYEAIKNPVRLAIANILSQGASECLGSTDYDLCTETFAQDNPVASQLDSQIQALSTTIDSVRDSFFIWLDPVTTEVLKLHI